MSAVLFRLLDAFARRRGVTSMLTGAAAAVAVAGGVLLGAAGQPAIASPPPAETATVAPGRTAVVGVVGRVGPAGFTVRSRDGAVVLIRTTEKTLYRQANRAAGRTALRRGQRVIVLGRVRADGRLLARGVSIRAQPHRTAAAPAR